MTLSSMVVSRDSQEVSVLECILGGLHIDVTVEPQINKARTKLKTSKIDALIVDCDLSGTNAFLHSLREMSGSRCVPLVIVSGSCGRPTLESTGAPFIFEKPISVEQAVHTLSAARNLILDGRLRYHRQSIHIPVVLSTGNATHVNAELMNLSQGGVGLRVDQPLPPAQNVHISFALPGSKHPMKMLGKVAWTDQDGNAGIQFAQVSGKAKRDLQLWLEKQYFGGPTPCARTTPR